MTRPPDWVGVGATKAGTTWWHWLIIDHPDAGPAVPPGWERPPEPPDYVGKQLHFFDAFSDGPPNDEWITRYHENFPDDGVCRGEWSPTYLPYYWVPAQLAMAAPAAKVLVILRDPVERYRSHLDHNRRHPVREFGHAVDLRWPLLRHEAFTYGLYGQQICNLLRHIDPAQVLLLQYERCVEDPWSQLERTYTHLGLDPSYRPSEERVRTNTNPGLGTEPPDAAAVLGAAYADDLARLYELCDTYWPGALEWERWCSYHP